MTETTAEELFTHTVTPLTLGDLRKAVQEAEGLPDELPLIVYYAEEPGSETVDEQVVISITPWNGREGEGAPPDCFSINCEFPSGEYRLRER